MKYCQAKINDNDYGIAHEIAVWKKKVQLNWDNLNVVSVKFSGKEENTLTPNEMYSVNIDLDLSKLEELEVGVEMLIIRPNDIGHDKIEETHQLNLKSVKNGLASYTLKFKATKPGTFKYGFRIYPINKNLSYRQDFAYVKWV